MLIVSQNKDSVISDINLILKEKKTVKPMFIKKETYEKYKKITHKKDNRLTIEDLERFEWING